MEQKRDRPSFFNSATCGMLNTVSTERRALGVPYLPLLFSRGQRGKVPRHYLGEATAELARSNPLAFLGHNLVARFPNLWR
jgi:hypothetical protein